MAKKNSVPESPSLDRNKLFAQKMAEQIIELLEEGCAPWQRPWIDGFVLIPPLSGVTGKQYRGLNAMQLASRLAARKLSDPRFFAAGHVFTNKWKIHKGATVSYIRSPIVRKESREGAQDVGKEKSTSTTDNLTIRPEEKNKSKGSGAYMTYTKVFHASQIEGPKPFVRSDITIKDTSTRITLVEKILASLQEKTGLRVDNGVMGGAYYSQSEDCIYIPPIGSFKEPSLYYATLLHEIGHSTGADHRLKRSFFVSPGIDKFECPNYAREEMRAEIFSYMMSSRFGFAHEPESHAAYIGGYLKVLKDRPEEIVEACKDAEAIMAYVTALAPEMVQEFEKELEAKIEAAVRDSISSITQADDAAIEEPGGCFTPPADVTLKTAGSVRVTASTLITVKDGFLDDGVNQDYINLFENPDSEVTDEAEIKELVKDSIGSTEKSLTDFKNAVQAGFDF